VQIARVRADVKQYGDKKRSTTKRKLTALQKDSQKVGGV